MFNPNYTLLASLLSNLTQIERIYGQLESLNLPKKFQLNLQRDNLIQSSYISNSIEGNPLSLPEVTNLLLDERVPVNRDEQEVKNYFDILSGLGSRRDTSLGLNLITDLHAKLLSGVEDRIAGDIRDKSVIVGKYVEEDGKVKLNVKHEPPFHQRAKICDALIDLMNWYDEEQDLPPVLKIGIFHHQFVYIHPFEDGNGRTCRLLIALLLLKSGYLINKYFVLDDYYDVDRMGYSDALNSADKGDQTKWVEYFTNGVKYSLQSAASKFKVVAAKLTYEERLSKREQEVLKIVSDRNEISSMDLAKILGVSRQQAHRFLGALVDKGLLEKIGGTKGSYYVLSGREL
jgi:Fic family protein